MIAAGAVPLPVLTLTMPVRAFIQALILTAALALPAWGGAQDLSELRASHAEAAETLADATDRLAAADAEARAQAEEIERVKDEMDSAFDVYELRTALRAQQAGVAAREAMESEARVAADALSTASRALAAGLRARVDALNAELLQPGADRPALVQELDTLNDELEALAVPLPEFAPVPIDAIVRGTQDTPEELYDAAAELTDAQARLERQLEEVRSRLSDAQARARLDRVAGELAAEESLLDDDGVRRFGGRGGRSGGRATNDEASNDAPTSGDGQSEPGTFDPDLDSPGVGAPSTPGDFGGRGDDGLETDMGGAPVIEVGAGTLERPGAQSVRVGAQSSAIETDEFVGPGARRSTRGDVGSLRDRARALEEELEAVRAERQRLLREAEALEASGRK